MAIIRVDVAPRRHFMIAAGIAAFVLSLALIIGGTGPGMWSIGTFSAYDCPDGAHEWSVTCNGVQMALNQTFVATFNTVLLNGYFVINVVPYNVQYNSMVSDVTQDFHFDLSFYGFNVGSNIETVIVAHDKHKATVTCPQGSPTCASFTMLYEEFIRHDSYRIVVNFDNPPSWLGDVEFSVVRGNPAVNNFEIGFRVTFALFAFAAFFYYTIVTRRALPFGDWTFEQRTIMILLLLVAFRDNPFYGFQYLTTGWFFPFIDTLFIVTYQTALLGFWIVFVDRMRNEDRLVFDWSLAVKALALVLFFILSLVFFTVVSIHDIKDPVFTDTLSTYLGLYWTVTIIWLGIFVYMVWSVVKTMPLLKEKSYLFPRFWFFWLPTAFVMVSVLILLIVQVSGSFARTPISFLFFATLDNVYIFTLAWGYMVYAERGFQIPNARTTEDTPLKL